MTTLSGYRGSDPESHGGMVDLGTCINHDRLWLSGLDTL